MADDNESKPEDAVVKAVVKTEISIELSESDKLKIEKEAREEVARELKASKMKAFKEAAKKRIQAEAMFSVGKDASGDDIVEVDLRLASFPAYIILDGAVYHDSRRIGRTHKVKRSVAMVLQDQMDRGWRQEEARLGEKIDMHRPVRTMATPKGLHYH